MGIFIQIIRTDCTHVFFRVILGTHVSTRVNLYYYLIDLTVRIALLLQQCIDVNLKKDLEHLRTSWAYTHLQFPAWTKTLEHTNITWTHMKKKKLNQVLKHVHVKGKKIGQGSPSL